MPALKRTYSTTTETPIYPGAKSAKKRKTSAKKTTLQRLPDGPFTRYKRCKMVYENALTTLSGGVNLLSKSVMLNSMFDFDQGTGDLGNKQPLYFDTLLSASGPYKNYKVHSWTTTWTFVNSSAAPMMIWILPPIAAAAEIDSAAEADNFPGVKRLMLTGNDGSKTIGSVTVTGNISDVYNAAKTDLGFEGAFNSNPAYPVYGGFVCMNADGTNQCTGYVAVRHVYDVELNVIDALVS